MNYPRLSTFSLVVVTVATLLTSASRTNAEVTLQFPIFSVLNGMQTSRLHAVLASPDEDLPCPVSLAFIDSQGNLIGSAKDFELRGGAAVSADFVGTPHLGPRARLQIRAQVIYEDPGDFPGCKAGVLASVEIFEKGTGNTVSVLTNPVEVEAPESTGGVDFGVLFLPSGATTPLSCQQAGISVVHFQIFDQSVILRTDVSRPCIPGERYRVSLVPGAYSIRVQGLEGQLICYEVSTPVTVQDGQIQTLDIVVAQFPTGPEQGCFYPPTR